MGWLRLVGSLQLQVSFAKEPYKLDLYSAKETYKLKEPTDRSHSILYLGQLCVALQCVALQCVALQCVALCIEI